MMKLFKKYFEQAKRLYKLYHDASEKSHQHATVCIGFGACYSDGKRPFFIETSDYKGDELVYLEPDGVETIIWSDDILELLDFVFLNRIAAVRLKYSGRKLIKLTDSRNSSGYHLLRRNWADIRDMVKLRELIDIVLSGELGLAKQLILAHKNKSSDGV